MYEYLLWLLIFVFSPLVILWIIRFKDLRQYKIIFFLAPIGSIIFSFPWDYVAIKERIWYFTEPHIVGIWLLGLPIEEWLFIIFVTLLFSTATILLYKKYGIKI
jgi:lycopene cyclase domain-containing protein